MPELDGFEATIEIRRLEQASRQKRIPIIALTANAMAQDRQDCLNAGMDDHLAKPLSRLQMQEMLERWMPPIPASQAKQAVDLDTNFSDLLGEADVIDRQVLSQLRKLQNIDDPALLSRVIKLYLVESPKIIGRMKQAVKQGALIEIERMSHSLKSSSSNVGANALALKCSDVHTAARAGNLSLSRNSMVGLDQEFARVQNALAQELETAT